MSQPVVLHVTRPYADADAYLTHEAWTIDARSMLLVEQADLPRDTNIVFDVTLADGSRPIRAEARVLGRLDPARGKPGGLRVRFKRYGASTKAFIDRAVALMATATPQSSIPPPPPLVLELNAEPATIPIASMRVPFSQLPPRTSAGSPSHMGSPPYAGSSPYAGSPPNADSPPAEREPCLERLRARAADEPGPPEQRDVLLESLRKRVQEAGVTESVQRA